MRGKRLAITNLRLLTILSRFVSIYAFAYLLGIEDFGTYGLIAATVAFGVYAAGADFYSFSVRQVITSPRNRWPTFIKSHMAFGVAMYLLAVPVVVGCIYFEWTELSVLVWLIVLLPLEHLCLEADRLLVAMNRQYAAAWAAFVRQGVFLLVAAPLAALVTQHQLAVILAAWCFFDLLSLAMSTIVIGRESRWARGSASVDWAWIWAGVRTCSLLLVGTISVRVLFAIDRQLMNRWGEPADLGAYVLFMGLASGISSVIASLIHQFQFPALVRAAGHRDQETYSSELWTLAWQTFGALVVASIGLALTVGPIVATLGEPAYLDLVWMMPWIILITFVYNLSLIPHYGLYAMHADKQIVGYSVGAGAAFLMSVAVLGSLDPAQRVMVSLLSAFLVLLLGKSWALWRHIRRHGVGARGSQAETVPTG